MLDLSRRRRRSFQVDFDHNIYAYNAPQGVFLGSQGSPPFTVGFFQCGIAARCSPNSYWLFSLPSLPVSELLLRSWQGSRQLRRCPVAKYPFSSLTLTSLVRHSACPARLYLGNVEVCDSFDVILHLIIQLPQHPVNCDANPGFQTTASGGDGDSTQYWYVGYDPSLQEVIVSHQGTNTSEL